jgi:hypothetical protein
MWTSVSPWVKDTGLLASLGPAPQMNLVLSGDKVDAAVAELVGLAGICRHYFWHTRQIEKNQHFRGKFKHFLGILGVLCKFWPSIGNLGKANSIFRLALGVGGAAARGGSVAGGQSGRRAGAR